MAKKESLGRGLGAIFSDLLDHTEKGGQFHLCAIEDLKPNRFQPRRHYDAEEQARLASSIRDSGVLQPILVRRQNRGYEIIAGERRWRAAQAAGLKTVPVVIRDVDDRQTAEITLIENLQREDLNPVEEAQGYRTLHDTFHLSHEEIAARVGKDRSTVSNFLRLLKLPAPIRDGLVKKEISAGHGRALLVLPSEKEQTRAFREILSKNLNVRQTEALVRKFEKEKKSPEKKNVVHPYISDMETTLSRKLMTRVRIKPGKRKGGRIEIRFHNDDDLRRLLDEMLEGK
ncbi:MAG TPA: ParB/RepB/Spo0J family partition protein [Syntrophales bacterium]|nr:ParB/RepB/Spo0J family partition protein [Syntrophales bacterium]